VILRLSVTTPDRMRVWLGLLAVATLFVGCNNEALLAPTPPTPADINVVLPRMPRAVETALGIYVVVASTPR